MTSGDKQTLEQKNDGSYALRVSSTSLLVIVLSIYRLEVELHFVNEN